MQQGISAQDFERMIGLRGCLIAAIALVCFELLCGAFDCVDKLRAVLWCYRTFRTTMP
ncbi:MAG: hypothetical protein ACI8W7_003984 [Gammaproteobacteria bacterium]|jgi:hypothetical protein